MASKTRKSLRKRVIRKQQRCGGACWSRRTAARLARLRELLRRHDRNCWEIGDLVGQLLAGHRISVSLLAQHTGYSKSRLSEFHLTAAAFRKDQRQGFTFQSSLLARRIQRRLGALEMDLLAIRREIREFGLTTLRQARAHFVRRLVQQQAASWGRKSATVLQATEGLIDRCHHADYRDVLPKLPDGSVKLFLADPPFGVYLHLPHGGYLSGRASTNGLRINCDNNSAKAALEVTTALFPLCLTKLAPGGCLVLFQPGCRPDRPEVLRAATENGWSCAYALTWAKTSKPTAAPGNCSEPYAVSSERILIFVRYGERLQWHEQGLSRSDVLVFESETHGASREMEQGVLRYGDVHMFQKPLALMEFLVRKHTFPQDLVVEPFACSGAGVVAAARLRRRWLYIESNLANFAWGSERVARSMASLSVATA